MIGVGRWHFLLVCGVMFGALYSLAPNFLPEKAGDGRFFSDRALVMGLDLQGGSHLQLRIEHEVVERQRLEALLGTIRRLLRREKITLAPAATEIRGSAWILRFPSEEVARRAEERIADSQGRELLLNRRGGLLEVSYRPEALKARRLSILEQSLETVRRRIDELGTREPSIQRQGTDRIIVQLPGLRDPEQAKAVIGKTARLTFQFLDEAAISPQVARAGVVWLADVGGDSGSAEGSAPLLPVERRIIVSGESLLDAQPAFNEGQPVVSFRFDSAGARRFAAATQDNVGRRFAIVLDEQVISAPVIRVPILDGSGIIEGGFSVEQTRDLSLLLRSGALPAPLTIVEERSVGPTLGADSIAAGKRACLLGGLLVAVVMIVMYGFFGVVAVCALLANLIILFGALSFLQATLTLPGITGIVLTLGMAVDANILVFERMREEVRSGRGPFSAVEAAYQRVMTTIFDANLTTFFAALALLLLGAGPVRGFAVTLSLGLLTSVFSSLMVSRVVISLWLRWRRPERLPITGPASADSAAG